jgi:hypothetical protein
MNSRVLLDKITLLAYILTFFKSVHERKFKFVLSILLQNVFVVHAQSTAV